VPQRPLVALREVVAIAHPALVAERNARLGDRPRAEVEVGVVVHQGSAELGDHQDDERDAGGRQDEPAGVAA
jgi:hypothetical protein